MRIGILGTGNVGGTLGRGWAAAGHEVMFGSREPQGAKAQAAVSAAGATASAGTSQQAVSFGEVIAIALPWSAVEGVLSGITGWTGKVVIDAVNRFGPSASGRSVAQDIAALAEGAHVVKAFNATGNNVMGNPHFGGQRADLFIAGDDAGAKTTVKALGETLGFEVVDVGPLANARLLESLAELWVSLARGGFGREIAFKLLRR